MSNQPLDEDGKPLENAKLFKPSQFPFAHILSGNSRLVWEPDAEIWPGKRLLAWSILAACWITILSQATQLLGSILR